jgi:anti-sigma factor ChrR (cupin superfamily)
VHDGGEEFLVLEGVFQDEHGDFPAGHYVRNPPTSRHTPASGPGCTILVKLHQFDPDDRTPVSLDWTAAAPEPDPERPGVSIVPLFSDDRETVRMERWSPDAAVALDVPGGLEAFVIEGGFAEGGETFRPWDWLRLPPGARLTATAGPEGAVVWLKSGHLAALVTG